MDVSLTMNLAPIVAYAIAAALVAGPLALVGLLALAVR